MTQVKIKIALADDEILFRKGIRMLLEKSAKFEIVFEASNGSELIDLLNQVNTQPDIVLMDLKMPLLSGVEATKIIAIQHPDIKIIALTSYNTKTFIANMIQVGAASYIIKNTTPDDVIHTITEVSQKGFYYNTAVMQAIHSDIIHHKNTKSIFDSEYLTNREIEILKLICRQKSSREIADELFISQRTVEGHRNNLLLKTESRNIAGLVVYAIRNKILDLE